MALEWPLAALMDAALMDAALTDAALMDTLQYGPSLKFPYKRFSAITDPLSATSSHRLVTCHRQVARILYLASFCKRSNFDENW